MGHAALTRCCKENDIYPCLSCPAAQHARQGRGIHRASFRRENSAAAPPLRAETVEVLGPAKVGNWRGMTMLPFRVRLMHSTRKPQPSCWADEKVSLLRLPDRSTRAYQQRLFLGRVSAAPAQLELAIGTFKDCPMRARPAEMANPLNKRIVRFDHPERVCT